MQLPSTGRSRQDILDTLEGYRAHDLRWKTGRTFGYVYDPGHPAEQLGKEVYASFLTENGLDPTAFPSLLRLENEVVGMVRRHLGGDEAVVGAFTSGGTESIICAVKAARDRFRVRQRQGLGAGASAAARAGEGSDALPELVLPVTAHAAFHKAAHYLGLKVVLVPVLPSFRADPVAMAAALNERTALVVVSAPSYAHGVVDPVAEVAAAAQARGIPCHVDACVGGWMLPYFRRVGGEVPAFDFSVPGVTSISVDLHKYAFCPKGASVVLYRDASYRRHQLYACAEWSGYSVVNMTVQSSKSGGPVAGAWTVLNSIGDDGYLEIARRMREATVRLVAGIGKIAGLQVLGSPLMSVLAFSSSTVNVFHLADEMNERGWYVQAQLGRAGSPASVHLCVGPTNLPWVDAFLADLASSVETARTLPSSALAADLRHTFAAVDPDSVSDEMLVQMMSMAGGSTDGLPSRRAEINQILDAMPPRLVERVLIQYMNGTFRG
jgi:glutamate/tyrosine decarboxylase-like PLP-dependent enzyme